MTGKERKIRALLLEDHAIVREGIARLLDSEPDFEVTAQCGTVKEALAALRANEFDVAVVDFDLGDETCLNFLTLARGCHFHGPIVILTVGMGDSQIAQVLADGAVGLIMKTSSPDRLFECIRQVLDGGSWLDQAFLRYLGRSPSPEPQPAAPRLTLRDKALLRSLLKGLTNKEIGNGLNISESAVKAGLQLLFAKTGVRSRSQLVRVAIERYSSELDYPIQGRGQSVQTKRRQRPVIAR